MLLFDHGTIGPDEQPGHGHGDALAFELSWDEQPVVTDSGVTTYEIGAVREFERSARAHATVTVGDAGADELWASFRVGGRAEVSGGLRRRTVEGVWVLSGIARAWSGWVHRRTLVFWPGQALVVLDQVEGAGAREVLSRLPLDPACYWRPPLIVTPRAELRLLLLRGELARAPHGVLDLREGWVGRGFGRAEARTSLVLRANPSGQVAYALLGTHARVELDGDVCSLETARGAARLPIGEPR
ncbi:MAG: heparinase II/III-family protein [Proteobacteria bacterium]|nr:heparinase II/III-family protein [Pseudomonadota bacterium]